MTYRELDEASNRLAHLRPPWCGPGPCVALLFTRSAEAIVGDPGVLKTGAAYLPIDPAAPRHGSDSWLPMPGRSPRSPPPRWPTGSTGTAWRSSRWMTCASRLPVHRTTQVPAADDIAHLIYTSGTTGTPKGVAVPHRNVTRCCIAGR